VADPHDDAVRSGNADATEWADEPIRIEAYDPTWPAQFEKERKALLETIGDRITGGVHHVGSTAVPGFDHHLHLVPTNSPRFREELAFRDHLRSHSRAASEYGALKRRLAVEFKHDREAYAAAKGAFIRDALRRRA
jgi:GrpB-like predicted nucleotidyltransferase (UPF0157 family)